MTDMLRKATLPLRLHGGARASQHFIRFCSGCCRLGSRHAKPLRGGARDRRLRKTPEEVDRPEIEALRLRPATPSFDSARGGG